MAENILDISTYPTLTPFRVYEKTATRREKYLMAFAYDLLPVHGTPLRLQAIWRSQHEVKQKGQAEDVNAKGEFLHVAFFSLLRRYTKTLNDSHLSLTVAAV